MCEPQPQRHTPRRHAAEGITHHTPQKARRRRHHTTRRRRHHTSRSRRLAHASQKTHPEHAPSQKTACSYLARELRYSMDATNRVRFCGGGPGKHTWSGRAWNSAPWRRGGPIHPPTGPSLNHGGAPFFLGGGAARWRRGAAWCPPPPPVMGSVAHFWGGGQQAAMCPPPQTAMGSGAHVWGGGQHPIAPTSSTPSVSLVSVHDSGGRRDAALYFSEDGNAGAVVPLDTLVTPTREPTGGGSPGASGESGDHSRRVTVCVNNVCGDHISFRR